MTCKTWEAQCCRTRRKSVIVKTLKAHLSESEMAQTSHCQREVMSYNLKKSWKAIKLVRKKPLFVVQCAEDECNWQCWRHLQHQERVVRQHDFRLSHSSDLRSDQIEYMFCWSICTTAHLSLWKHVSLFSCSCKFVHCDCLDHLTHHWKKNNKVSFFYNFIQLFLRLLDCNCMSLLKLSKEVIKSLRNVCDKLKSINNWRPHCFKKAEEDMIVTECTSKKLASKNCSDVFIQHFIKYT